MAVKKKLKKKSIVVKKRSSKKKSPKNVGKRKKVSKAKKKYPKRDSQGRFVSNKKPTKKSVSKRKYTKKTKRRDSKTRQRVKPKSKPKLKLVRKFKVVEPYRVKFFELEKGSAERYSQGGTEKFETYMASSHGNTKDPELALPAVFEKAFIGSLRKTGYFDDIDQILIYRFGIIIRPRLGKLTERFREKISEILKPIPGVSIHHVIEDEKTFSIRINLGSPVEGILSGIVSDELKKFKSILGDLYAEFKVEYNNAVEWYSFWDVDEEHLVSH